MLSAFTKLSAGLRALSYLQISPRSSVGVIPSLGTILVVVAYMGFILALQFINATTGDDQSLQALGIRAAWLSMAQIPLIFLLATKKNVVTWFTAAGYERLNVLHRWTARGLLLTATLHFAFQNVGWSRFGVMKLEWSTDSCPPTGKYCLIVVRRGCDCTNQMKASLLMPSSFGSISLLSHLSVISTMSSSSFSTSLP